MYWMAGWPPGGSAGTSFCRGTEMSISLRAMAVPRSMFSLRGVGRLCVLRLCVLPLNPVLQNTDLFDLEFDAVAMLEIPAEFQAAAIADGTGADEFTRHQ